MHIRALSVLAVTLALAPFTGVAHAAEATPIANFRDWYVYSNGTGADRVCYALTQPKQTDPKGLKRDPAFLLISTWPGKKVRNEPSIVAGFSYKDGSKTSAQVGSDKFEFFTKNDGGWIEAPTDEKRMLDAMKRGANVIVTGFSTRGTMVKDTFSLAGISAALDKIDQTCK